MEAKHILIASGSFKDVYNPQEACEMLAECLTDKTKDVKILPVCDGGEYTYGILKEHFNYEEIIVDGVYNPYREVVTGHYLAGGDTAHIVSSEIMRLYPEEDCYKNPLKLTDYGYGQLIRDAYERGYRKFLLYLGGTSTACCGMGCAQALGVPIKDKDGNDFDHIITGEDLENISAVRFDLVNDYKDIEVTVIGDGDCRTLTNMRSTIELKVGETYSKERTLITDRMENGIVRLIKMIDGLSNRPYSGTGGSVSYGFHSIFHPTYIAGGDYIANKLGLEEEIKKADLVITGEGRFDNAVMRKAPVIVAQMARRAGVQSIYVCGQIDKAILEYGDKSGKEGILTYDSNEYLKKHEIERLYTCQPFFAAEPSFPEKYIDQIKLYREKTPVIIKKMFQESNI